MQLEKYIIINISEEEKASAMLINALPIATADKSKSKSKMNCIIKYYVKRVQIFLYEITRRNIF